MRFFSVFIVSLFFVSTLFGNKGDLTVSVEGLRIKGTVIIVLFNSEDGYPVDMKKGMKKISVKVKKSDHKAIFKDLKPGYYAVAVFHDENNNGEIDTNWLGIPKEGVGVSNKAKGFMGPPKFKDAKFKISSAGKSINIPVNY